MLTAVPLLRVLSPRAGFHEHTGLCLLAAAPCPLLLPWHKQQSLQHLSDERVLPPAANAAERLSLHMEVMAFTLDFSSSHVMFDIIYIFNRILHEQKNEDHILH